MNESLNIGCVVYKETDTGIKADWVFSRNDKIEKGEGMGVRSDKSNKKRGFEGEYEITYTDENGNKSPKLKLFISLESEYYSLKWINNETITDFGIGIENDNKLIVIYSEFNERLNLL